MQIRAGKEEEWALIQTVNESAFETPAEASLVTALREHARPVISLVAEDGRAILGHIMFSPVRLPGHPELKIMGLAPMAASPEHQRQGIGSKLVRAGLEERAKAGHVLVIVPGTPNTTCALDFDPQRILAFAGNMIARRRYLW